MMKMLFRPVRDSLKEMRNTTKQMVPDSQTRANALRQFLKNVGTFIADSMNDVDESRDGMEKRFW